MSAAPDDPRLQALAAAVGERLLARGWTVTAAESCTGGWIAKALTDVAGSSGWFGGGLVTYSNELKSQWLGVAPGLLARDGAVSRAVVEAMAAGARAGATADCAVAVSGIAGPDGGSADKPVGTVWFAWWVDGAVDAECHRFSGDREAVRRASVAVALQGLLTRLDRRA